MTGSTTLRVAAVAAAVLLSACGTSSSTAPTTAPPASQAPATAPPATEAPASQGAVASAAPSGDVLRYLAFGDSWPEGAHCGGCRTFAGLWADGLEALAGRPVKFTDMTGDHERSLAEGKDSTSLLSAVRNDSRTRDAIAAADVILIATGPNEQDDVFSRLKGDTCGGADGADCIRMLGATWQANFDAILAEIDTLRAGKPTVVRLVSAANPFVSYPEMTEGMPDGFATGHGALIFQELSDAMCEAAAAHAAVCIDARPILNGPTLIEPVAEDSPASMRAVADALLATGVAELDA